MLLSQNSSLFFTILTLGWGRARVGRVYIKCEPHCWTSDVQTNVAMKALVFLVLLEAASADDKIVGGYECLKQSVPYHALLKRGYFFCHGALISSQWVLSTVHCYNIGIMVQLGERDDTENESTMQLINSARVLKHPLYNSLTQEHNIMLIKLITPAIINSYVQPVPLPSRCPVADEMCLVSGWSSSTSAKGSYYSARLQCLRQPIISDSICRSIYFSFTDNMVCCGFMQEVTGSCSRDYGSPLVCSGQLQGVFAWGDESTPPGYPSVFTRVCRYISWINGTMQNS
ncbi:trypsin-like isoform X2 [Thalassophryne amazonica]|uniref:trypsin-like isoform X2 n=1 Tax=Thalassophryne amazonica TaxID=390379 RepID=UPI0014725F05|nr:trypsin-like isoform X2 [Thalassophryne amazonica]